MSTPFDIESAKFLNDLMDVYKISSSDITNKPFVKFICGFGKPIILSTGASNLCEVQEAVGWIEETGNPISLLHCVLNYPTADKNANLAMITGLKRAFPDKLIGYSDHTLPQDMKNLEVAFLLGAVILEKHFTFDKTLPGNDHYHAMDKEDLKKFIKNLNCILRLLGKQAKQSLACEQPARQNARRSLVARNFISKGKAIKTVDLTWKRPALGISPRQIDQVIGLRAKRDIKEDDILKWCDLKD
jgi:N-acetylneuraminate synthase